MNGALHLFTLAGIPVRVTIGFLLLIAYYGYSLSGAGAGAVVGFVGAITLSILIHEFGHGLVARRYKLSPHIQLHMWGGLCFHERARKNSHDVFIVAAGPLLAITVGAIVLLVMTFAAPHLVSSIENPFAIYRNASFAFTFTSWFVWFSILWGALNMLVPIWPLDGGQLFRMLMLRVVRPARTAERIVHVVGLVLAVGVCVFAITVWQSPLLAIMSAMWALENGRYFYMGSPVEVRARSEQVDRLLVEASQAAQAGEWHEARRVAFQARDEANIVEDQLAKCFAIIVVASAELRDFSEALAWTHRAPKTPAVFVAKLRALCGTGKVDQARAELEAADAPRIDAGVRAMVEGWIAGTTRP